MSIMGNLYVWLDKRVEYTKEEVSNVLGIPIDEDLQTWMTALLSMLVGEQPRYSVS